MEEYKRKRNDKGKWNALVDFSPTEKVGIYVHKSDHHAL